MVLEKMGTQITLADLLRHQTVDDIGKGAYIIRDKDCLKRGLYTYSCPKISPSGKLCDWGYHPDATTNSGWIPVEQIEIIERL